LEGERGNYDLAEDLLEQCVSLQREIGERRRLDVSLLILATILCERGKLGRGEEVCRMAFDLIAEMGRQGDLSAAHRIFGMIQRKRQRWNHAIDNFERSIQVSAETKQLFEKGLSHYEFGLMWNEKGELAKAKEQILAARVIFEKVCASVWLERARLALEGLAGG